MTPIRPWPQRLQSLTSLRFVAAFAVFAHHTVGPDGVPVFDVGFVGVTFFFVLSGFVLTWAGSADRGALSFYRNRFARIYPLHLLTLLLSVLLPFAIVGDAGTFVQNLFLVQSWTPSGALSFNWVSWSISDEAFFYLLFPALVLLLRRASSRVALSAAAAVLGLQILFWVAVLCGLGQHGYYITNYLTYDFPPFRFAEFAIGVCLARYLQSAPEPPRSITVPLLALGSAGIITVLALDLTTGLPRAAAATLLLPAAVALIGGAAIRERDGGLVMLRHRWLVRLGEWSFAFYLVHGLVIRAAAALLHLPQAGHFPLWTIPLLFVVAQVLAAGAHHVVERPFERLLRAPRPAAAVVVAAPAMKHGALPALSLIEPSGR